MGRGSSQEYKTMINKLDTKEVLSRGKLENTKNSQQPNMFPVESSYIDAIGYSLEKKELHISFKTNNESKKHGYYADVPEEQFNNFLQSSSKGKYVRANLGGKYTWSYLDSK